MPVLFCSDSNCRTELYCGLGIYWVILSVIYWVVLRTGIYWVVLSVTDLQGLYNSISTKIIFEKVVK